MIVGKRARRIGFALGTALTALVASGALAAQTENSAPSASVAAAKPSQPWPQSISDVPADKAVRFGTLANGMRYAIMHSATPPEQSSLMLRIDAGSLMEKDNQLGLAHFMEHMAFNGTTHIPKNDLILTLQRLGLAFGADLNAATSFDQTFYQLHLPKSDDKTIDTGLFVLREQVSEATMDQQDIVDERGVIAGEERLRNSPALRVTHKHLALIAKGQKVADRFPIGDLNIINTATRDRFVDFYNSYYRPSRATIVAVGDFDVDAMEAKIKKQFGDWQPKGVDGPEPDLGKVATHHGEVQIFVEPGAQSSISLTWVREPDLSPDTMANRRRDTIKELGLAVLNRRLGELSRTDNPPFTDARAVDGNVMRSVRTVTMLALFNPGKWKRALAAVDREQRQLVEYGVTDVELAREVDDFRLRWRNAAATASTRNTRNLAAKLINAVNDREVVTAPDTDVRIFEEAVKGLTAAQVNAQLKPLFAGPPMTIVDTPAAIPGGETAIASALTASRSVALPRPVVPVAMPWPYTNFGKPGTVVARRELAELGATIVTFQNGVTLTFKHTDFDKDSVKVEVLTGSGEQAFPADKFDPRFVLIGGLEVGGLGRMTYDDIRRTLNGHVVSSSLATLGDRFLLSGTTRGEDLQLQTQSMTAYLTDAAYRSAPFERMKATYPASYKLLLSQPAGAFEIYAKGLLAGGDTRSAITPPEAITSLSMDAYRPQLKALLSKGPIEVTMVGDLTLEDAIRVTANTFGALPPRPPVDKAVPGADKRALPAPTAAPLKFTHEGLAEQSMGYIAWPTTDVTRDLKEARRVEMLNAVLKLRVYDEIRERLGLAYSPGVGASFSDTYKDYGLLTVSAQTAPEKLPAFFKAMDDIVDKLRNEPITPDELKRAREPLVASALRSRNTNGWWVSKLTFMVDRPWYEPQIFSDVSEMESLTPADIQALARKYLRPELAWKAEVLPQAPAPVPAAARSQ